MDVWVVWDGSDVWDVLQCVLGAIIVGFVWDVLDVWDVLQRVLGAIIFEIVDNKILSFSEQVFSNVFKVQL